MTITELSNNDRANWAQPALDVFTEDHGEAGEDMQNIGDLIINLLHLARRQGCKDVDTLIERCIRVYDDEVSEL